MIYRLHHLHIHVLPTNADPSTTNILPTNADDPVLEDIIDEFYEKGYA